MAKISSAVMANSIHVRCVRADTRENVKRFAKHSVLELGTYL